MARLRLDSTWTWISGGGANDRGRQLYMKIATFNINNINRRLPNLLAWMRAAKPDVVALQELKASDGEFPAAAIEKAGYGAVWRGQKTGTASPSSPATPSRC